MYVGNKEFRCDFEKSHATDRTDLCLIWVHFPWDLNAWNIPEETRNVWNVRERAIRGADKAASCVRSALHQRRTTRANNGAPAAGAARDYNTRARASREGGWTRYSTEMSHAYIPACTRIDGSRSVTGQPSVTEHACARRPAKKSTPTLPAKNKGARGAPVSNFTARVVDCEDRFF